MYMQLSDYNNKKLLIKYNLHKLCPPCLYPFILNKEYKNIFNCNLNLKNPLKLSEKLQWIKIYDNNRLKSDYADKIKQKELVRDFYPDLKTAKIYKIYNSYKEIDFSGLPDKFFLKTNHSWGTNICIENKDKITSNELRQYKKYYKQVLKINFAYWSFFELQYKNIKPKVFAEEYIGNLWEVKQYSFWCFNGKPEFISLVSYNIKNNVSQCHHTLYNINKKKFDFNFVNYIADDKAEIEDDIEKMIYFSKILSNNFKFVRIDYALCDDDLYLLEMTFSPYSGFVNFSNTDMDFTFGNKLVL